MEIQLFSRHMKIIKKSRNEKIYRTEPLKNNPFYRKKYKNIMFVGTFGKNEKINRLYFN